MKAAAFDDDDLDMISNSAQPSGSAAAPKTCIQNEEEGDDNDWLTNPGAAATGNARAEAAIARKKGKEISPLQQKKTDAEKAVRILDKCELTVRKMITQTQGNAYCKQQHKEIVGLLESMKKRRELLKKFVSDEDKLTLSAASKIITDVEQLVLRLKALKAMVAPFVTA